MKQFWYHLIVASLIIATTFPAQGQPSLPESSLSHQEEQRQMLSKRDTLWHLPEITLPKNLISSKCNLSILGCLGMRFAPDDDENAYLTYQYGLPKGALGFDFSLNYRNIFTFKYLIPIKARQSQQMDSRK